MSWMLHKFGIINFRRKYWPLSPYIHQPCLIHYHIFGHKHFYVNTIFSNLLKFHKLSHILLSYFSGQHNFLLLMPLFIMWIYLIISHTYSQLTIIMKLLIKIIKLIIKIILLLLFSITAHIYSGFLVALLICLKFFRHDSWNHFYN